MVRSNLPDPTPEPQFVQFTVCLSPGGDVCRWEAVDPNGGVLEDWQLVGVMPGDLRYTWQMSFDTYVVVRDVIRFITEEDWQPNTVL